MNFKQYKYICKKCNTYYNGNTHSYMGSTDLNDLTEVYKSKFWDNCVCTNIALNLIIPNTKSAKLLWKINL